MSSPTLCFVCNLPILTHQVGLVWQGGNGIDELVRDLDGGNALSALRTRLGQRDSATQFSAISPPRTVRETSPPGSSSNVGRGDNGRRRSSLAQITDLLWGTKDKTASISSQGGAGVGGQQRSRGGGGGGGGGGSSGGGGGSSSATAGGSSSSSSGRRESLVDMALGNLLWMRRQSTTTGTPSASPSVVVGGGDDKIRKRRESMTAGFPKKPGRRDSGMGSGLVGSSSSVGIDIAKFLSSRRDRDSSLSSTSRCALDNASVANTTVELSQTLRERLKERHDSIGLMSRRRCSAMGISALARASASASRPSPSYGGSGGGTASNGTATSPTNLSGHAVNAHLATSVSPTGPVLPVVVTASSSSKSPASPLRLSPVQGSQPTSPRLVQSPEQCSVGATSATATSMSASAAPASSFPSSPEGRHSPAAPIARVGVSIVLVEQQQVYHGGSVSTSTGGSGIETIPSVVTTAPPLPSTPPPLVAGAGGTSTVAPSPLSTLGVSRHRRKSRSSASPEQPMGAVGGIGSTTSTPPVAVPSGRLPRLRRQSTTLDEGVPTGGKTGRRGSRPFLSPDAAPAAAALAGALQTHRDSLSPDSAAEEALGSSKIRGRRDSRPHLSPDGDDGAGGVGNGAGLLGADGSPRSASRGLRRQSTTTDDIYKSRSRRGSKANKPSRSESSSTCSSREPSPKEPSIRRQSTTTEEILIARGFRRQSTTEEMMRCRNFRRQSTQSEEMSRTRGRRDSCAQIIDGTVATMTVETTVAFYDTSTQTEPASVYDNNYYHEECLRCNACGVNLTGPSQKRARRFKNQIFCDLHFADVALMESSDFMQQLRSFKPQSLGCAVARRKSSTTLIFPLPPQACSDEFCEGFPHRFQPTPGYWIECSRQSSRGHSGHGIREESQEDSMSSNGADEEANATGGTDATATAAVAADADADPGTDDDDDDDTEEVGGDGGEEINATAPAATALTTTTMAAAPKSDAASTAKTNRLNGDGDTGAATAAVVAPVAAAVQEINAGRRVQLVHQHIQVSSAFLPEIRDRMRRKTTIEEQFERSGTFELTSVEQETYERYFYGTEHWNYFTNDEDLGPIVLSLKQEIINGRDQFRVLVRAISYTSHGLIPASCVFADRYNREEVVRSLGKEINLNPPLILGQLPDTPEELLKLDQVFIKSELKVGVIYVKEGQYSEEEILDNNEHSPLFDEFLQIIGDKVRLKGFDKYKGGLDTVHDLTGLHSVYTYWRGIEIMFHVSTLLPYEKNDPQKLQRKRHVGNDIVCVVFLESDCTDFSPACIKSHFLHTFILVQVSPRSRKKPTRYEVSVVTRDEVGAYKPYLWEQSSFCNGVLFREWILTKIVNGERASYSAPKFARMQERTRSQMLEDIVANLQNHAETGQIPKPYRRGSWRPIGHMRPSSPLLDSVRDQFEGYDQLAKDFSKVFLNMEPPTMLFDVSFLVGQGKQKQKLYGVRAILGVRSRVFQEMLYGICTGFGSPQVPVAELLARAAPTLHSPVGNHRNKSSNFLQVPDIESPRPKSVPSSPSVMRAFSRLGNLTAGWGRSSKKQDRLTVDDKKWTSSQDCTHEDKEGRGERGAAAAGAATGGGHGGYGGHGGHDGNHGGSTGGGSLAVPRLSVCADVQKVDRSKLAQSEFAIIEFDAETFRLLLDYLHTGSCPLTCNNIPGLICAAEHYDLPELLQACFHHAKQFLRIEVVCSMLCLLENYYWRYTSASELVNMILLFIETRAYQVFQCPDFLSLSESIVQMIMARNLEVPEVRKFEAMLQWAKHKIRTRGAASRIDAKIEFRCTMERLTRDLRLYRISPQDLIKVVLPSKAIKNERILETLMFQANSGMYRIQDSYLEACQQRLQKQDSRFSEWDSFDYGL